MKDPPPTMRPRALPVNAAYLQRRHALLLVLAVLLLHLWLLQGRPLWFSPKPGQPLQAQALITRQIEVAAPRAPQVPKPAPTAPIQPAPVQSAEAPAEASGHSKPLKFDDFGHDLTAPVGLPARSASGVDLPPFKRATGSEGLTEATAFKAPESAVLKYQLQGQVKGFPYAAAAELQWTQDGKDYEARLEVSAFLLGSRVQVSKGKLGAEGLMPTRFGDKTRSELAAHFQRDKGIISFSANSPDVPLLKGAQDRLSVVLQLSTLLAGDPTRFPVGTMLSFQTVSQREAEVWQFLVEKEESLQLPYGLTSAIKLNRQPRRQFDQHIELWLAPSLGYLPVRLRITNANGDVADQLLSAVEKPSS
jgi:hypothetical protein